MPISAQSTKRPAEFGRVLPAAPHRLRRGIVPVLLHKVSALDCMYLGKGAVCPEATNFPFCCVRKRNRARVGRGLPPWTIYPPRGCWFRTFPQPPQQTLPDGLYVCFLGLP